jgi:2'-5' RNA ligase
MATIRAFLAVKSSPEVRQSAQRVIAEFAEVPLGGSKVKWVEPEQSHITIKFFGDIAPEATSAICRNVQSVLEDVESFQIDVKGVGAFPDLRRPRTIWAGVDQGADRMVDLATRIEAAMEPLGYPREHRRFHPHLTLGRLRGRGVAAELGDRISDLADSPFGRIQVTELVLLSSELARSGPVYNRMATLPLR